METCRCRWVCCTLGLLSHLLLLSIDSPIANIVAYRFAGSVAAVVTSPLEVVKTRLQSGSREITSLYAQRGSRGIIWANLSGMVAKEGVTSLWKGLSAHLVGVAPSRYVFHLRRYVLIFYSFIECFFL